MNTIEESKDDYAICIVEDITHSWTKFMQNPTLNPKTLQPKFFSNHLNRRLQAGISWPFLWTGVSSSSQEIEAQRYEESRRWRVLEGQYLYGNQVVWTRFSYYKLHEKTCELGTDQRRLCLSL